MIFTGVFHLSLQECFLAIRYTKNLEQCHVASVVLISVFSFLMNSLLTHHRVSMNLLLIEDDERIAQFMIRGLEAEQWRVVHVRNCQEYETVIGKGLFDCVLCDMVLGGDNGLDICRHIRHIDPLLPIIVMTAKDEIEWREKSLAIGVNDYLSKPFSFDDLLHKISHCLGFHHPARPIQLVH